MAEIRIYLSTKSQDSLEVRIGDYFIVQLISENDDSYHGYFTGVKNDKVYIKASGVEFGVDIKDIYHIRSWRD